MARFQLRIGEEQREFDAARQGDRLHLTAGERTVEARVLHRDGDALLIEITPPDGLPRRVRLVGARRGDKRLLWIDGRALTAERARPRAGKAPAADGSLAAAIPAVVSQLLVAPGDVVAAGDKLILLESMKMVIPIVAPHDGRVGRIHCAPGDSVAAGVPLLEIEPT
jgi:acetyl/propionyl-CoA carboxylase alpha subunit